MNLETIRSHLGTKQPWQQRADGWWLVDPDLDVEPIAGLMIGEGARLVTITARPAGDGECRLGYHWDVGGRLFTFVTMTRGGSIPSIAVTCPAADWIERETHDYFAVNFTGREDLQPLVLRAGDRPGLFHWNGHQGGEP
jgi:hypothetical protein